MNLLDAAILLLLVGSAVRGFRRGAALQLATYSGLVAGLLAGAVLGPTVAQLGADPFTQAGLALGTLVVMAGAGDAIGWAIGRRAWAAARGSRLDPVDSAAGSVVGVVAVVLVTWFLAFNLVQGPFPPLSRQIRQSTVVRTIDAVLPRPPGILAQIRTFLDRFGFPEVFAGLPPAPAGPVDPPSNRQVRRALDASGPGTLRVVG
ncbi:MAG: CvpA family protein, partial [Actinomycetota bacterium]|nr:CvpA family protein [Actinomycetota bacterium]